MAHTEGLGYFQRLSGLEEMILQSDTHDSVILRKLPITPIGLQLEIN